MPDNRKPLIYGAFPACRNYTVRAHLRHAVPEKRGGRENAVRRAGSLLGGVHAEHLHSRHGPDEARCRRCHWWGHQPADAVNTAKKYRAKQENSCLALSGTFRPFPRVGQRVSLDETPKIKHLKKLQIIGENHRNQAIPVIFVVCRQKRCRRQSLVPQWVRGYNPFLTRQTAEHPSHGGYSAVHLLIHRFPAQSPFCCPGTGCGWFPRPPP